MKKLALFLAVIMVFAMVLTLCPSLAYAEGGEPGTEPAEPFIRSFHLDAGRKYFSPDNIKAIIDILAEAGMSELELYFSDNQGFRLAL